MITDLRKSVPITAVAALAIVVLLSSCSVGRVPSDGRTHTPGLAMTASEEAMEGLEPCDDLPSLPTALCGSLDVPLDRTDGGSATTTVSFALVPRTDTARPGLGTIVPNPGGPGSSAIDFSGGLFAAALEPLRDRRDVLLIDPRGVGRSDPLTCDALDDPAVPFGTLAQQRAAIGRCGQELGARAGDYGTAVVADDLDAVRKSLGVDKFDLLGLSYGSFLMTVYAERYPDAVRSIALAGAYSVHDDPMNSRGPEAFRRAVELTCERIRTCDGAVVLADLAALAERLRAHPDHVETTFQGTAHRVVIDEWQLASVAGRVFSNVPDSGALQALAAAAAKARTGNLALLRAFVTDKLTRSAEIAIAGTSAVSLAQSWATTCHDYVMPFNAAHGHSERRHDIDKALASMNDSEFAPFSATAWITRADYDAGACLEWPAGAEVREPFPQGAVLPDVPVLVLNGDLDANTTSVAGREAAAQFPHAVFVEIPGAGHTPATTEEGLERILTFIVSGEAVG